LAVAIWDGFPVTSFHTLVIPRRHAETWFDLYEPERRAIGLSIDDVRASVIGKDPAVTAFLRRKSN
jgi:ATP adenylyltransferase